GDPRRLAGWVQVVSCDVLALGRFKRFDVPGRNAGWGMLGERIMKNIIALSIPFFFLLITVELIAAWRLRRHVYRFTDAVTDLGSGIPSELAKVFLHGALLAIYVAAYQHRFIELGTSSIFTWVFAFVAIDFLYYWWHRASHEVNVLWAAHVVHHTSEDYNLA